MSNARSGRWWEDVVAMSLINVEGSTIVPTSPPVRVVRWPGRGKIHKGEFIGYFESKGQCDFEGGYRGVHVALEAKRCSTARWNFKGAISDGQKHRMHEVTQWRGIAGVVLCWDIEGMAPLHVAISWWRIADWLLCGAVSVTPADLISASCFNNSGVTSMPFSGMTRGIQTYDVERYLTIELLQKEARDAQLHP